MSLPDCEPLKVLVLEAATGFMNATGKFIEIKDNDSLFDVKKQFPGTRTSVISKRNSYVGILYSGTSQREFDTAYVNALNMLYDCLSPDEYEVLQIRESGKAQAKYYPDIQFLPRKHDEDQRPEASQTKTTAPPKVTRPTKTSKPAKAVPPPPAPPVKKPVTIYMKANNGDPINGNYKLEILIHPN